jgi:hypothetical protein
VVRGIRVILRLDLPGDGPDPKLEEIGWEEWFRTLEENGLVFVYGASERSSSTSW